MHDGIKALPNPGMGVLGTNQQYFTARGSATTINGVVNVGDGLWDTSVFSFNNAFPNGNVILAVNTVQGYGGGAPSSFANSINGNEIVGFTDKGRFRMAVFSNGHTQANNSSLTKRAFCITGSLLITAGSAVLSSGGSLTVGQAYFYKMTWFDVIGNESPLTVGELTATPTSGNQTITVNWIAPASTGQSYYRVYRSTTSGNYTNANYYTQLGTAVSFVDTGQAASGTATPSQNLAPNRTASSPGYPPYPLDAATAIRLSGNIAQPSFIQQVGTGTTTKPKCLFLGSGPCDGATGGFYSGNSNTLLAMNSSTGFIGNLCDFQVAGSFKMSLDSTGTVRVSTALRDGVGTNATARVGCYYNFS